MSDLEENNPVSTIAKQQEYTIDKAVVDKLPDGSVSLSSSPRCPEVRSSPPPGPPTATSTTTPSCVRQQSVCSPVVRPSFHNTLPANSNRQSYVSAMPSPACRPATPTKSPTEERFNTTLDNFSKQLVPFIESGGLNETFESRKVQLISFMLPKTATEAIPAKISDGQRWIPTRISSIYRQHLGKN